MEKELTLKNDVIFQTFFARKGNEEFLVDFLSGLLELEIQKIEIREEVNLEKISRQEKGGRLDLQATLNDGIIVNIEMQIQNKHDIEKRTVMYGGKVISRESRRGMKYEKMKEVIMINILDYDILKYEEYVSKTAIVLDQHREYEIIKGIRWYFIELPKFRRSNPSMENKVNQWLALIDNQKEMIEMAAKKNKVIEKAKIGMRTLTGDAEIQRLAELKEKWDYEYNMEMKYAKEEGIEEGIEKGKEEGREEGKEEEKRKTAKKLLDLGMSIEQIKEITGLSKEQIKSIKNN